MNHNELYLMLTIAGRERMRDFISLYKDKGLQTHFVSIGRGTAQAKYLSILGLSETEKMVAMTVVTGRKSLEAKKAMSVRLHIEAPGIGVACIVPLAAFGGKRELMFLTDGQGYEKGAENTLKGTEQVLLIAIGNQGYSEQIMDAARAAGARGGTVIRARGTGQETAERFLGISLASDKDVILIVAPTEDKTEMMQRIMREAGPGTGAGAVVFALPVTDTAGMTLRPVSESIDDIPETSEPESAEEEKPESTEGETKGTEENQEQASE
ncbi:MAG: P-II family nitrogen regulator [Clostridia bacterium]|nr:P-II family nitrogen regulator [Clostridia bacterium]